MSKTSLHGLLPAFGLLPDIAEFVCDPGPDQMWVKIDVPPQLLHLHDPVFMGRRWKRLAELVRSPIKTRQDSGSRQVLVVLGCFVFVRLAEGQWRVFEWTYKTLGEPDLRPVHNSSVIAQHAPWRTHWLKTLVRPLALEYLHWHGQEATDKRMEEACRYVDWMMNAFGAKLRKTNALHAVRGLLAVKLDLNPETLRLANRILHSPATAYRATLGDYEAVHIQRKAFATIQADAPHLFGFFGVMCQARGFPRTGEPLERLRRHLLSNGVSPRTWALITRLPARFWLAVNDFYPEMFSGSLLDFVRCLDLLGVAVPAQGSLVLAILGGFGGPARLYERYPGCLRPQAAVWRHVISVAPRAATDHEFGNMHLVVQWIRDAREVTFTRAQRRAGWKWLVKSAQRWDDAKRAASTLPTDEWITPFPPRHLGGYEFIPLRDAYQVWSEGREMRHCAGDFIESCSTLEVVLVSVRRGSQRLATLAMRKTEAGWEIEQMRGKCNTGCTAALWRYARQLKREVNA